MKIIIFLLLLFSTAAVAERLLVQPQPGTSNADFARALAPHGGAIRARILDIFIVDLPEHASERAVAALLARHPHIKFAEVDRLIPPAMIASDPGYDSQWSLRVMEAPAAWDYSQGTGVLVAVLDTGVDSTHPDLQGQVIPGWNVWDNNSDTSDVYGHGTPVAGVIAASCNNGIGIASIACDAKILPVRISRDDGWAYLSTIAQGVVWAADHGAKVANISYTVNGSSAIQTATQYLRSKGGVVVTSAGNDGKLSLLPDDEMITVAATDSTDTRASWSSYGSYVDFSAPGVDILSTARGGGYTYVSGTSFSAPLVAGVIALMLSANPDLGPEEIEIILHATAIDLGASGYDVFYGYGRVDAGEAVRASVQRFYPTDAPPHRKRKHR